MTDAPTCSLQCHIHRHGGAKDRKATARSRLCQAPASSRACLSSRENRQCHPHCCRRTSAHEADKLSRPCTRDFRPARARRSSPGVVSKLWKAELVNPARVSLSDEPGKYAPGESRDLTAQNF